MKLKELISFIWNDLDIPVTKLEIQNGVNELCDEIRNGEFNIEYIENEPKQVGHHSYTNV